MQTLYDNCKVIGQVSENAIGAHVQVMHIGARVANLDFALTLLHSAGIESTWSLFNWISGPAKYINTKDHAHGRQKNTTPNTPKIKSSNVVHRLCCAFFRHFCNNRCPFTSRASCTQGGCGHQGESRTTIVPRPGRHGHRRHTGGDERRIVPDPNIQEQDLIPVGPRIVRYEDLFPNKVVVTKEVTRAGKNVLS